MLSSAAVGIFFLLVAIPIAALIMGQIHQNDCPIQPWIPKWMTIFGAVTLTSFCIILFAVRNSFLMYN
jgi:hypothetical protein